MTVQELINELLKIENKKAPVKAWLPGTRIALSSVFENQGVVFIEGNVSK